MAKLIGLAVAALLLAGTPAHSACEPAPVAVDGHPMFRTPLSAPYEVGNGFGLTRHPLLNIVRPHVGIDLVAPLGTPILAPAQGEVVEAQRSGEYGNRIVLRHRDGVETDYAHLSRFASGLTPGKCIAEGEVIGYVGTTGLSTGPHLHLGLSFTGQFVDPVQHFEGLKDAPRQVP